MKILVIASHTDFNQSRVNKRLLEEVMKYPEITLHNLNETYPDEVIDQKQEQELLLSHDRIVFQYPIHWYNTTPILRKWQDEVITKDLVSGRNGRSIKGKEYLVAISTGGRAEDYRSGGSNNFTISEFLRAMQQISTVCKMHYLPPFVIHNATRITDDELEKYAKEYIDYLLKENTK